MSKSKTKNFRAVERDYWDGVDYDLRQVREEKNRKREKRVQHALKTKNVRMLAELDEEGMVDPIDYEYNEDIDLDYAKVQWK